MTILGAKFADLQGLERGVRWLMCVVATGAAITGLAFEAGLLSMAPQYERQSWYLVSEHAGFIVTSVADDEAACRKREKAPAVCYSGGAMQARPASGKN
ncbi:MAG: hypothetical protein H7234_07845 [Herminiimonas sp.]|nr:hypothetical protein [Herminiimonas sp.]